MSQIEELKDEQPASVPPSPRAPPKAPVECNIGLLCDAYEAMSTLANEKIDSKATAKMLKLVKFVEPIYEEFVDLRKETVTRLGVPVDGEEGKFTVSKENLPEFAAVLNDAAKKAATVPKRLKLVVADLEGAKVSPATMIRMRFLIADLDA